MAHFPGAPPEKSSEYLDGEAGLFNAGPQAAVLEVAAERKRTVTERLIVQITST